MVMWVVVFKGFRSHLGSSNYGAHQELQVNFNCIVQPLVI